MTSMTELQYIDRLLQIFRRSSIYDRPHDIDLNDADIMVLYCLGFCEDLKNIKLSDIASRLKSDVASSDVQSTNIRTRRSHQKRKRYKG